MMQEDMRRLALGLSELSVRFLGKNREKVDAVTMSGMDDGKYICRVILSVGGESKIVYYVESPEKVVEYRKSTGKYRNLPWIQAKHVYGFIERVVLLSDNIDTFVWSAGNHGVSILMSGESSPRYVRLPDTSSR